MVACSISWVMVNSRSARRSSLNVYLPRSASQTAKKSALTTTRIALPAVLPLFL